MTSPIPTVMTYPYNPARHPFIGLRALQASSPKSCFAFASFPGSASERLFIMPGSVAQMPGNKKMPFA